ncbi:MAG: hypothetical protein FWC15_01520 [Fibromonadales bacterium]|nr:hypothetical protein [Fibromonadales bacterium]
MSKLIPILLILVFVGMACAEGTISFNTVFFDSTGKLSYTYPVSLPNQNALHELQRNFTKQKFGAKFIGQEPAAALRTYKHQNEEELEYLSDEVSFPLPGIVQFVTSFYANGTWGSDIGIYSMSDGKRVEVASIFNKNWEKDIIKLIVREFLHSQNLHALANYSYTQNEMDFIPTEVKISEYGGLEFVYPVYKIAPGTAGEQIIFLSWGTLMPHLNPKSVIYSKIRF